MSTPSAPESATTTQATKPSLFLLRLRSFTIVFCSGGKVQADVISVPQEKLDVITLDFFSFLLPVLLGLLDSKVKVIRKVWSFYLILFRHASISLEMLLKLVAVFGTLVRSIVSAPLVVGVDLQAEERCFEFSLGTLDSVCN
ncbi:hypothetical protein M9H77_13996 [Catharanthus roseus]|uniref:Uncharacterized protein n=1 Tax=Catharanthus roseus TaxID=4058 RepID=A0ACC0BM15_CATRO|nr:hypothetical protein M9H77_13996 [Catharanthus roseus]